MQDILSILVYIFIFLFGLCIGSFLNCVIYRIETNKNFLKGRSFCPECKRQLVWKDLFPVLSFLYLKGKCRYCKKSISRQYIALEIFTGLLFLMIFNSQFSDITHFWASSFGILDIFFLFYIASSLIIIFVYDLKHYIIPDNVLFPAIAVAFLYRLVENFANFSSFLLAAAIASGFFLLIFLVSKGRWMGFGDVKLAVLMGLLLGLPNVAAALFLAFFAGSVIGVGLIAYGKKGLKSEIPFAPFLIAGTFFALFWGQNIIDLYLTLFV